MDDFDVVLGMEFLLEHQVIPMPSAKCLAITGSFPTVVPAYIRQPNGFRMISAMQLNESRAQGEPPSVEILLGALEKPGETVPKDTVCVPEKRHGVMPSSWPKSSSRRRRTDHGKEPPSEAKAHAKNAYRMAPSELTKLREPSEMLLNTGCSIPVQALYGARVLSLKKKDRSPQQCVDRRTQSKLTVRRKSPLPMLTRRVDCRRGVKHRPKSDDRPRQCRVRTTKAKGLERSCVTRHEAYEFPVAPLGFTDAKGGKCCFVQGQVSALIHVGEPHHGGSSRGEDTQWSKNLECRVAFNGSKQTMIEGPSLGVVDATKTPEVEAEQLSCVLEEYLHHCVDGRQRNWVQRPKVAQFGSSAQTDSPSKRSPFEIEDKRHSALPLITDGPCLGDRPQVHRVGEECEQMANIARVCLEEASRPMEERQDQKRCPLELEGMTKLPSDGATTPYDYLSTWTWRKTEKSRKALLTE
ncbi:reverse transcriptase [Cucumis melo var. makuwa]|uniref:Reverse transcriptase n=1 Tax=Cucumis melo var. makuwa TaxID=1194695 RepID=A0A5A7TXP0_CUCMM|nr:reverse transcriptase [Cucumis melo var. makuwa]